MRGHIPKIASAVSGQLGLVAPLLLLAALAATYAAGTAVSDAARAVATKAKDAGTMPQGITLARQPIPDEQAVRSAERLARLVPTVRVSVVGKSILVSTSDVHGFPDWMYALTTVQTTASDVLWEAEEICLGTCEGGMAAHARITGYRQTIRQTGAASSL
jgi:hypothetical protein